MLLLDGGLSAPLPDGVDPQAVAAAVLGPALARLNERFPSRAAYHDWWRAHPAFANGDVLDGTCRVCRPRPRRRAAGAPVFGGEDWCAPTPRSWSRSGSLRIGSRYPPSCCAPNAGCSTTRIRCSRRRWRTRGRTRRRACVGRRASGVNHYTIVMGASGARAVAGSIVHALQSPSGDPGLRSGG